MQQTNAVGNKIHNLCSFKQNNHFYCVKSGWGNSRSDNSISTRNHMWHHWFSYTADNYCNFGIGLSLLTEMDHKLPLTDLVFAVLKRVCEAERTQTPESTDHHLRVHLTCNRNIYSLKWLKQPSINTQSHMNTKTVFLNNERRTISKNKITFCVEYNLSEYANSFIASNHCLFVLDFQKS